MLSDSELLILNALQIQAILKLLNLKKNLKIVIKMNKKTSRTIHKKRLQSKTNNSKTLSESEAENKNENSMTKQNNDNRKWTQNDCHPLTIFLHLKDS